MPAPRIHTLLLLACWLLLAGAGFYATSMHEERLARLQEAERLERRRQEEMKGLSGQATATQAVAEEARRKLGAQHKVFPAALSEADVAGHLNRLTRSGFQDFRLEREESRYGSDFNVHTFRLSGSSDYARLYRLVWDLENGRPFFRIDDLRIAHRDVRTKDPRTGAERLRVLASFTMTLHAYFGGGLSTLLDATPESGDSPGPPPLRALPAHVFPARQPAGNPFYPLILNQLPPNTYGRVDVEQAELVSIVGETAVFKDRSGYRTLQAGDAVYLGRIEAVEPAHNRVVVRLDKGGIAEVVRLQVNAGPQ